jgi:hypothetical protein
MSLYLFLELSVCRVYFGIEAYQWRFTVKSTPRGVNEILAIGCLLHQSSHGFENVCAPVFDGALLIVIASHILDSV